VIGVRILAVALVPVLGACAGNAPRPGPPGAVTGTVTYRERMALPASAELRLQLFDVTSPGPATTPVADTTVRAEGRPVPLPFVLRYDPKRIDPRHVYALRATLLIDNQPLFATRAVIKVITWDHPDRVDLVLSRARAPG